MRRSITRPDMRLIKSALQAGLDFIFPPRCAGCGQPGAVWCSDCDRRLVRAGVAGCVRCGFPRVVSWRCLACELGRIRVRSFARYQPPLKQAILRLKYHPDQALADRMAAWLSTLIDSQSDPADLIVPVPLGDVRRKERGYNQVELIASALARDLNIPVEAQSLARVRETRSQVGLDPEERFGNIQQAFRADTRFVENRNILLLDDLLTSGATLLGCARALFNAGASSVLCLTVGRTIG
ncbi:MAG: ComF family protein [Anaerolineales bacterium]|nr:ComF family protein [Anaerolineales bacterium]